MSNANVELVQQLYGAFKRGDIPTVLAALVPDASWAMVGREEDVPMAGYRSGRQGAGDFFRIMAESVEITSFEPREFHAAGDAVFVHGTWSYVGRKNGCAGENEWLHVVRIRDGQVMSWRGFNDTAQIAAVLAQPRQGLQAA